jgi:hypothetical protein
MILVGPGPNSTPDWLPIELKLAKTDRQAPVLQLMHDAYLPLRFTLPEFRQFVKNCNEYLMELEKAK